MKKSFADILSDLGGTVEKKMSAKIPEWAGKGVEIPGALNLEQCSSSATAAYKASLIGKTGTVADLTGGLGVDCLAFSKVADKVLYVERDKALSEAAGRNFVRLGSGNIEVINAETDIRFVSGMDRHDWIFLDPARRDGCGHKVFLLEDCSPNIVDLLPKLLEHCGKLMVKLSPMADITMLRRRLGDNLKEIHIVGSGGECKELLCILENGWAGKCNIIVCGELTYDSDNPGGTLRLAEGIRPGMLLHEPVPSLMKAGCFPLICSHFSLSKLSAASHLFLAQEACPSPLFKKYLVLEMIPFGKAGIREAGSKYPVADVSSRGLRISSEELRDRLKCKSGEPFHIFGADSPEGKILLATRVYMNP